jgi:Spy/CpxP family protein refolding chaperone
MYKRLLTTLLFASVAAFAQGSSTAPTPAQIAAHEVTHLTKLLSLSTPQQTQATAIFTTEETAILPLMASFKTARTALTTAIEANDSATIAAETTEIGTLTAQEQLARATAEAALYAILTPTQQTSYAESLDHGRFEHRTARHGEGH